MTINGVAPYKAVLTHGFTVDADGRKMSKSLGNVIPPQQVMNSLGADVLRLWVAATDFSAEMSVSDEILTRMADSYRRIRNTARYLLANMGDYNPDTDEVAYAQLLPLDQWAIDRAAKLQREIIAAYDSYQFHQIYQKLHNFCVVDMSGFYLDIIKDRQYTTKADSLPRRSAQVALYHIAEAFTRWVAPILSYTADELWDALPGKHEQSVFVAQWYSLPELPEGAPMGADYWSFIADVKNAVNKVIEAKRNEGLVGKSLSAQVRLYCEGDCYDQLRRLQDELRFVLITSSATVINNIEESAPADAEATDIEGLTIVVEPCGDTKCVRCWHHRADVGEHAEHPELCNRCVENVAGDGETRQFA